MAAGHSITPARWQETLDELLSRIAGRFTRVEPRRRARAFVRGLLASLSRTNCWTLAEHAGDATPDGMQHLLARAVWDADAVRDDVRDYLLEHLGDAHAVLVVDETGDCKKGTATVGVQRQYTGTSGKIDNAQVAVYLTYASPRGHGLIDRELYLPRCWTQDAARRQAAGVPEQVAFATKPELARQMLERALAAGVPAAWVTADEVYGSSPGLRGWLETPAAALCAGRQVHSAAAAAVRAARAGRGTGRAGPTGVLAAYQRRARRQGAPMVCLEPPAARWGWRAAGVGTLAADPPQPENRRAGVLRLRRPGRPAPGRPGAYRRDALAGGGVLPGQQGAVRPGRASGAPLALLVPVGDPGHAGLRLLGRGRPHRARPASGTPRGGRADLQRGAAAVRGSGPGRRAFG